MRTPALRAAAATSLALAASVLSACSGPKAPYDVGTQAAPVNLVLGAHQAVVQAPVGPVTVPLPPSLAPFLPLPELNRPPVKPEVVDLGPCPPVDKLTPVSSPGLPLIQGPPQPGSYTYRASTTDTVGKTRATYRGNSTWKVTASAMDPVLGGWHVTVDTTYAKTSTRRVFLVVPRTVGEEVPFGATGPGGTDPNVQVIDAYNSTVAPYGLPQLPRSSPNVGRFGPAGIYLESQQTGSSTFTPTVPMPIFQTPLGANAFTAIGTDGVTAMSFHSTVTNARAAVNACGKKVEGVRVALTDGVVSTLTPDGKVTKVDFTETISFGLQFGGVPIHDVGTVSTTSLPGGLVAPDEIKRGFEFTTNSVLKPLKR
jgi:hypothetical protein